MTKLSTTPNRCHRQREATALPLREPRLDYGSGAQACQPLARWKRSSELAPVLRVLASKAPGLAGAQAAVEVSAGAAIAVQPSSRLKPRPPGTPGLLVAERISFASWRTMGLRSFHSRVYLETLIIWVPKHPSGSTLPHADKPPSLCSRPCRV